MRKSGKSTIDPESHETIYGGPDNYDVFHCGVSGGKDSQALMLWAVHDSGFPIEKLHFTFCDTGNESPITLDHVRMLSDKVHPIEWLEPKLGFYDLVHSRRRFPSACARICTESLKMEPTKRHIDAIKLAGYNVLMLSGVRAGESEDRAKLPMFEPWYASGYFETDQLRPLLRWSLSDVWAIHEKYNIQRNPLYDLGAQRVGCLPCIMSRKAEIANIADRFPERIDMIREQEFRTGAENRRNGGCGFATMFAMDKVPKRFRTAEIQSSEKVLKPPLPPAHQLELMAVEHQHTVKPSEKMFVGTIDDIVRWSREDPDRLTEEFDFFEEAPPACDSRYGACE